MQASPRLGLATAMATPLLAVGVYEDEPKLAGTASQIDAALGGLLQKLVLDREVTGKNSQVVVVHTQGKLPASRIALVGLGKRSEFDPDVARRAGAVAAQKARDLKVNGFSTEVFGRELPSANFPAWTRAIVEGVVLGLYEYNRFKKSENGGEVAELTIVEPDAANMDEVSAGAHAGRVAAEATNLARDLSNGPPNLVTPEYLAEVSSSLSARLGFDCEIFDEEALRNKRMEAILAVGVGSVHPPRLIVMRYNDAPDTARTLAAVGKGITFDSGGISIKPAESMGRMKHDMSGAASVIGFMQAVATLKLPINVLGIVSAAENMLSAKAYRPSDIITRYSGKTIEIISPDAEGRMVLSDALSYAVEQGASGIVDLATLTGACVIALGTVATGLFGNDDGFTSQVEKAGSACGERLWRLPLWEQYGEQVKSEVADLRNTGGRHAGAITAAWFLSNFVGDVPWVHLDIAGTAYVTPPDQSYPGKDRPYLVFGATGVGVRTLLALAETWS